MAKFRHGFLSGTGTRTEFEIYTLEPRDGSSSVSLDTSLIDSIIGPENPNANFRHAPYHCSYHYPGYKTNAIGFVICSWDKLETEKLTVLFVNYLREYLQLYEAVDYERYKLSLVGLNYEKR